MKILIVYATYSGGTRLAALTVENVLKKEHEVTVKNVFDIEPQIFSDFDVVVLGSNSWFENKEEGQMNSGFHKLKERATGTSLSGKKVAVFALGDSNLYHNTFCKSSEHLQTLAKDLGGEVIFSPLKVDRFYFDEDGNEEKIIAWSEELSQFLKQEQSH